MKSRLIENLEKLRADRNSGRFILADAKDADMAWGVASPGPPYPLRPGSREYRSMPEFHEQIREIVRQGAVDVLLASASTMSRLAYRERLFDDGDVTPAVRMNDATDIWLPRGGRYRERPSRPFSTVSIEEVQGGESPFGMRSKPVVDLGLYSVTFNNSLEHDLASLEAFRRFRTEAARLGFHYFLEVFAPNMPDAVAPEEAPNFVNDSICRMLAGVPLEGRPEFLKIPYFGPAALADLAGYDPSMIIGILGGSSGTTLDAYMLLAEAKKHGARVALFGRKIKDAERPLEFVAWLRRVADEEVSPEEAVRGYHGDLQKVGIPPRRDLAEDLQMTASELGYLR